MRRFIRLAAATAAVLAGTVNTTPAAAQGTVHVGAIAGVDFATFTGADASGGGFIDPGTGFTIVADKGSSTGFLGGLFIEIPMGTSLVFEPELLYAGKGAKYATTISDGVDTFSGDLTFNLDYITIPALLHYNFQASGGPYALIGPEVSFNVGCSVDASGGLSAAGSLDCSSDLAFETNTTFGGIIGLGFQRGAAGLEARYDFDFGSAFKDFTVKNSAWEIVLRYQFK